MGTYKVGSDGKAPKGLQVGDFVVTGGGTYEITGFNPDGTYISQLANKGQTTYNYDNYDSGSSSSGSRNSGNITAAQEYAQDNTIGSTSQRRSTTTPVSSGSTSGSQWAGQGASVTNYGQGKLTYDPNTSMIIRTMPDGRSYYVNPGDEKYNSIYAEYVANYGSPQRSAETLAIPDYEEPDTSAEDAQLQQIQDQLMTPYQPVDQEQYTKNVMSLEDAFDYATRILTPEYDQRKQEAVAAAAQNLDRAGLYNSLYGQGLQMAAENQVNNEMQSAINELAMSLVGQDRDYALNLLNAAINENQYGAGYNQSGLSQAANISLNRINNMVEQAKAKTDYALQAAALEIQREAAVLEQQYQQGQITQTQLENKLMELEIAANEAELAAAGSSQVYSAGGSGGSGYRYTGGGGDVTLPGPTQEDEQTVETPETVPDWIVVPGYGRVTPAELETLVANDKVKQTYHPNTGRYTYRKIGM